MVASPFENQTSLSTKTRYPSSREKWQGTTPSENEGTETEMVRTMKETNSQRSECKEHQPHYLMFCRDCFSPFTDVQALQRKGTERPRFRYVSSLSSHSTVFLQIHHIEPVFSPGSNLSAFTFRWKGGKERIKANTGQCVLPTRHEVTGKHKHFTHIKDKRPRSLTKKSRLFCRTANVDRAVSSTIFLDSLSQISPESRKSSIKTTSHTT